VLKARAVAKIRVGRLFGNGVLNRAIAAADIGQGFE
jgi:hypothetical protein